MKDKDVRLDMKVKINIHVVTESNILYEILESINQDYAYVNKIYKGTKPTMYVLSEKLDGTDFHFFYSNEFDSYIKEDRKLKLKKL